MDVNYQWEVPSITTRKRNQLTIFGIGTNGIQVVDCLYRQPIKDARFGICHTEEQRLRQSPVTDKLWYAPAFEDAEQNLADDLRWMVGGSELTIIIADLSDSVDCHLAKEAVRVVRALDELVLVVFGKSRTDLPNRQTDQAIRDIEQLTTTVSCTWADMNQQQQVFQLAGVAFRLTEFCYDFTDADFDDLRSIIQSPGRIAVMTGKGEGDDRVDVAFGEVVAQCQEQQFINTRTKKYSLLVSSSGHTKPITVREHGELMKRITNFIDTEPADVRMGFITDESLWEQLVIHLLLWMPLERSVPGPLTNAENQ